MNAMKLFYIYITSAKFLKPDGVCLQFIVMSR